MTMPKYVPTTLDTLDKDELLDLILETAKVENGLERLKFSNIDINHQNSRGWCLLFEAASFGSSSFLKKILDSGVLINIRDDKGRNALFWALYKGNSEAATILIKRGIEYCTSIANGISSIHYAVFKNDFEVLKTLSDSMDVNIVDRQGSTPLMCAAFYDREDMIKHLILKGASCNRVDKQGDNIVDYASSGLATNSIKVLKQLGILDDVLYKQDMK